MSAGDIADALAFCVEETNRYRQQAGRPPLERSSELEAYAAEGARVDAKARRAHHHFARTPFRGPYRGLAENEIPWWSLRRYGSLRELIRAGLATMWAEGPGGPHHENLIGEFVEMGCGVHIDGDAVTVVQDFRLR